MKPVSLHTTLPRNAANLVRSATAHLIAVFVLCGYGCTGGVPCPTAIYEPVGALMPSCGVEDTETCARDEGMCVLFCTTNCADEIAGRCSCEPCGHVTEWVEENCPDPECLERSTSDEVGWDLALSCTND
jgi:hypothetical protein